MFRFIKIYFSYTLSQDSTRGCIPAKQGRKEEMSGKETPDQAIGRTSGQTAGI